MSFSFTNVPVLLEHLKAIALSVADIDQVIFGNDDAVHRISELLLRRRIGIMRRAAIGGLRGVWPAAMWVERAENRRIVRFVAVRAPDTLELAGIGIHHDDAVIDVSIGHVRLVRLRIHHHLCWLAEAVHVKAVRIVDSSAIGSRT